MVFFYDLYVNWQSVYLNPDVFTLRDFDHISFVRMVSFLILPFPLLPFGKLSLRALFVNAFYFFHYCPLIVTIHLQEEESFTDFQISLAYLVAVLILCVQANRRVRYIRTNRVVYKQAIIVVLALMVLVTTWVVISYRDILGFSSFFDGLEQRFAASSSQTNFLAPYFQNWMATIFAPLMIVLGMERKKPFYIFFAIILVLISFSVAAQKIVVINFIGTFFFYYLLRRGADMMFILSFGIFFITFISWVMLYVSDYAPIGLVDEITSLMVMRFYGTQASLVAFYADFFQKNGYTYWSHISIINMFIDYPYAQGLGQLVGYELSGRETYNASATFTSSDGIASVGLIGVPIVGFIASVVFRVWDSLASGIDKRIIVSFGLPATLLPIDGPLFTSILTGGILVILLLHLTGVIKGVFNERSVRVRP